MGVPSPMANASVTCAYVMQPPDSQRTGFTGLLGWTPADSGQRRLEGAWRPRPVRPFHLAVAEFHPCVVNP